MKVARTFCHLLSCGNALFVFSVTIAFTGIVDRASSMDRQPFSRTRATFAERLGWRQANVVVVPVIIGLLFVTAILGIVPHLT